VTVFTAQHWVTNADMIVDVARMGYLDGSVLDATWGSGNFWTKYRPPDLTGCDIDEQKSYIGSVDIRHMPFIDGHFDNVVCDLPYRLNGTPDRGDFDERYGIEVVTRWQDRYQLILDAIPECARVAKKRVLLKCQDQVCSGVKRWQTMDFTNHAAKFGLVLEDRFDLLHTPRVQRSQRHTHNNYSTLLVLRKTRKRAV